jgi:superfamily II DNA/RNA helicase
MSTAKLKSRIDKQQLSDLIVRLKKSILIKELFSEEENDLSWIDIRILAEAANILAISEDNSDKMLALEIAVYLPQINKNKGIAISSLMALRKLGNFPAINLLQKEIEINEYKHFLGGISALEEYVFQSLNERELVNDNYLLTNFQNRFIDMAYNENGLSLSAPTSAGKSFVLLKYVLDFLYKKKENTTVVYIVPTRALIKQVTNDFKENIRDLNLKHIYLGSSSEIESVIKSSFKSKILVLTQERLFQLCAKQDIKKLNIEILIVDEAHSIESGGRGVLLERAINFVKDLFPVVKIFFSSPLVSNPEKFLTTFDIKNGVKERDQFPLVSQNIINVKQTKKFLTISCNIENKDINIKKIPFHIEGGSKAAVLANVAIKLWNSKTSIIYCNEPAISATSARILCNSGHYPILNDERLEEFSEFIDEYISDNYELAEFIRRGIAFHFGALPPIIRSGIEELFKEGVIKIVCCTSTLLEGLNMPAKNIFMFKPEKGRNTAMDSINFWNLAGRAGRMGNDFSGNIICINPDKWEVNPLLGDKQFTVIPSSESRLKEEASRFKEFISDRAKPSGIDDYNEQLVSLVVKDRLEGKYLINSPYKNSRNELLFADIDDTVEEIINEFLPPVELLYNVQGIIPDRINDFWNFLKENQENYKQLVPLKPFYFGDKGYYRFKEIIGNINRFFMNNTIWSDQYINKLAITGYRWLTEEPLSRIIFYKKEFNTYRGQRLTSHVKDQIDFLDRKVRFELVKYIQIYTQVIKEFLKVIGKEEEAEKIINLTTYLEFGVCSIPALEFMGLGLPREAAIRLSPLLKNVTVEDAKYYADWLNNLDVDTLGISKYLKNQIRSVQEIF